MLGPITAFALLSTLPGAFDAIWITSFIAAVIGLESFGSSSRILRPRPAFAPNSS